MGWHPTSNDNLGTRCMCVIAELTELEQALLLGEDGVHSARLELADVAMYLSAMLYDLCGPEYPTRSVRSDDIPCRHQRPSELIQPTVRKVVGAFERWRRGNLHDATVSLQLAMLEACRLSWALNIDLSAAVRDKIGILSKREERNGGKRADT